MDVNCQSRIYSGSEFVACLMEIGGFDRDRPLGAKLGFKGVYQVNYVSFLRTGRMRLKPEILIKFLRRFKTTEDAFFDRLHQKMFGNGNGNENGNGNKQSESVSEPAPIPAPEVVAEEKPVEIAPEPEPASEPAPLSVRQAVEAPRETPREMSETVELRETRSAEKVGGLETINLLMRICGLGTKKALGAALGFAEKHCSVYPSLVAAGRMKINLGAVRKALPENVSLDDFLAKLPPEEIFRTNGNGKGEGNGSDKAKKAKVQSEIVPRATEAPKRVHKEVKVSPEKPRQEVAPEAPRAWMAKQLKPQRSIADPQRALNRLKRYFGVEIIDGLSKFGFSVSDQGLFLNSGLLPEGWKGLLFKEGLDEGWLETGISSYGMPIVRREVVAVPDSEDVDIKKIIAAAMTANEKAEGNGDRRRGEYRPPIRRVPPASFPLKDQLGLKEEWECSTDDYIDGGSP